MLLVPRLKTFSGAEDSGEKINSRSSAWTIEARKLGILRSFAGALLNLSGMLRDPEHSGGAHLRCALSLSLSIFWS